MTVEITNEDEADEEENPGVSYGVGRKGPSREDMVAEYLPEQDDWVAKTVLDLNDPGRVAVLANLSELFPEIKHQQPVIDDFLDNFLRGRTSIGGESREQYNRIFEAMHGGHPEDKKGNMLIDALAGGLDEDD